MQPCRYYALNYGKEGFKCEYDDILSPLFLRSKIDGRDWKEYSPKCSSYCPKFADCCLLAGETFRKFRSANCVVNNYGDGRMEIVYYKDGFVVPEVVIEDSTQVNRGRLYRKVNDILIPVKEKANRTALERSIHRSGKHALDKFKGYALANKWDFFFTFTFSPSLVPARYDRNVVEELWRKVQRRMCYYDKNCKILKVPEPHHDGAIHFHALISLSIDMPIVDYGDITQLPQRTCGGGINKGKTGFCTFTKEGTYTSMPEHKEYKQFLVPYYDYGELQRSSLGDILFCLNWYPYGRNSCAILPHDETNQDKVCNYLSCYMFKSGNTEYNQKRFSRTKNLANKEKIAIELSEEELQKIVEERGLLPVPGKETEKMIVFRNFNAVTAPALVSLAERMKK